MEKVMKNISAGMGLSVLHRPKLSDKPWVDELLSFSSFLGCEHAFGTAFIWTYGYGTRLTRMGNFLVMRGKKSFAFPAGRGDIGEILSIMKEWSEEQALPFLIHGVTESTRPVLEDNFPDYFQYVPMRDSYDYIYLSENLINLSGKKFHGKRNHISKFSREYDWQYEDITENNLKECLEIGRAWCREKLGEDCTLENNAELCALSRTIDHFFDLEFKGGLIRVDGKAVAFTCGEHLNDDTFVIHFEKTLPGFEGAYPVINNQFAKHRLAGYRYINREEDLGIEGLRKAKLSYYPDILLEKFLAVPRDCDFTL